MPGVDGMCHNIYRWERGGRLSERYKLHYCHAFGIHPSQFGPGQSEELPGTAARAATAALALCRLSHLPPLVSLRFPAVPDLADPRMLLPAVVAYREGKSPI